jgi:acyl-CoA synthetase (AMP-forming)/AMP-acid ligase II/aryl carrier-like protein
VTGLSHVLFTSGSTGTPAAVAVPHGPLRDFLAWYTGEFGLSATDRFALTSGPGHDPVLRDMFTPLWLGAQLHVPPAETFDDPTRLRSWLAAHEVTVLHITPGLLELVLVADGPPLPRLRLLVVGGAPLTYGLARLARAMCPARILTAYGSTETPQIVACHDIDGPELAAAPDDAVTPIGSGVAGYDLTVRTPDGRLAGVGQRGELVVRGGNLAIGYLGRQRGTGFGTDTSGPFYRTGDLGRLDPYGRIHVDGRRDRQVQVDGYRVELAEVEAAALQHAAVRHAAAVLADTELGPVLTLDVDADRAAGLTVEALRSHLRTLLPPTAIPASIRMVEGFVLGPNQKLLPGAPVEHLTSSPPTDRSPSSSDQTVSWLRSRFRDVVDHPLRDDENFFDAGLNSVLLLRMHVRLTRALGRDFPVTALFAHPNLRALAGYLDGSAPPRNEPDREIRPATRQPMVNERLARREFRRRFRDQYDLPRD